MEEILRKIMEDGEKIDSVKAWNGEDFGCDETLVIFTDGTCQHVPLRDLIDHWVELTDKL